MGENIGEIKKISEDKKEQMLRNSVMSLPDNPSKHGYTANEVKRKFVDFIVGDGSNTSVSVVGEINRIVEGVNAKNAQQDGFIQVNAANIATNAANIATNAANIATNAGEIESHATAIAGINATNESQRISITDHTGRIAALESEKDAQDEIIDEIKEKNEEQDTSIANLEETKVSKRTNVKRVVYGVNAQGDEVAIPYSHAVPSGNARYNDCLVSREWDTGKIKVPEQTFASDDAASVWYVGRLNTLLADTLRGEMSGISERVDGLQEIHNAQTHFLGWYPEKVNLPQNDLTEGDYAWVGNIVYVVSGGQWIDTDQEVPGAELGSINTEIAALTRKNTEQDGKINTNTEMIGGIETSITDHTGRIAALESKNAEQGTNIANINATNHEQAISIADNADRITALGRTNAEQHLAIKEDISALESDVAQAKEDIAALQAGGGSGGSGGTKLYRHKIRAVTRDNDHNGYYEVIYVYESPSAKTVDPFTFNPPEGALASYRAVPYDEYEFFQEYGTGAFNLTTEFGTPYFSGIGYGVSGIVQRSISFAWEGYESFEDIVEEVVYE